MHKTIKDLGLLLLATLFVTLLIWLPHILALKSFWGLDFSNGFFTIYRNFDGLEYVTIAKTFYNPSLIAGIPQQQQAIYYASHFPGYALLINIFAPILGYLKSMLFTSLLSTIFAVWAFYLLLRSFNLTSQPLFLSFLFLVLPARWLIVHSVGSSEPLFIFLVIATIYFVMGFEKTGHYKDMILAGISGFLAQLTRPPAILLFIAIAFYIHWRLYLQTKTIGFYKASVNHLKYFPLALIPLGLLGIFYLYGQTYGDFWAYFHSGDNIHLSFPPFQVFNKHQFWVGDIWLEDIVYIFILGFLGGMALLKKKLHLMAFFVLTYMSAATLIAHRDVSRYILPVTPFILIAFEKVLTSKEFKIILPIILLASYLYAQNFILANTAPIADLIPYN